MKRIATEVPTTPIEIAKSRPTVDERFCFTIGDLELCDTCDTVTEEELDEDEDAVLDVVLVMLLVCDVEEIVDDVLCDVEEIVDDVLCDVEEIVDEVLEGSRTSKLNHNKSIFFRFPEDDGQLT